MNLNIHSYSFTRRAIWTILGTLALAAPGLSQTETFAGTKENGRTAISPIPWTPPEKGRVDSKLVYGTDDRVDVYAETNPARLQLAQSVCGLFPSSQVTSNGNGTFSIGLSSYTFNGDPACTGEPFRTQPVSAFCTGFLVGEDLIATAGHCFDAGDLSAGNVRFVFGFQMSDAYTPVSTVPAANVYTAVQLIAQENLGSAQDYAIIRVDRAVVASGALPLEIRRTGTVPVGTAIGVIGHPAGLPLKIAFGPTTQVYNNTPTTHFVANLDTYGGNSGSPVFNATTGVVEGILVRGESDYVDTGSCFVSYQLADNQAGEEVTKTTFFASLVPELSASITLGKAAYGAGQAIAVRVRDIAAGPGPISATITTTAGDSEVVALTLGDTPSVYTGTLAVGSPGDAVVTADGTLQGANADTITATYVGPVTRTATAALDLVAPIVSGFAVTSVSTSSFTVGYTVAGPVTTTIRAGQSCSSFPLVASQSISPTPSATLSGLQPATTYLFEVVVADAAGNETVIRAPNDACLQQTTRAFGPPSLTDNFDPSAIVGWTIQQVVGAGAWAVESEALANTPANVYRYRTTNGGSSARIRLSSPSFSTGDILEFYHSYDTENGYDGCFLEISTDGGTIWTDLGPHILSGGYNAAILSTATSADAGKPCWGDGTLAALTRVEVDLSPFPGAKKIGFRFSADSSIASPGWIVDSVNVVTLLTVPEPLSAGYTWILFQ